MAINFAEYYDPNTGIIHLWGQDLKIVSGLTSAGMTVGLSDSSFSDPKMKILTIKYQAKMFQNNRQTSGPVPNADNNTYGFNFDEIGQTGLCMAGICNENNNSTDFEDLNGFEGTSAWPVDCSSFATELGSAASFTKTWRPDKLAISDQQTAFLCVTAFEGGSIEDGVDAWTSIYIRGIRL